MLKNKLAKVVSLMMAVFMIATVIQMPVVSAAGTVMSVTDTTKKHPFFDLEGDITSDDYTGNWYALNSELSQAEKTGYLVFSFDGTKTAVINGVDTIIKGTPQKIEFALLTYNWVNYGGSMKFQMSADKVNWYTIKENGGTSGYIKYEDADSALRAKYADLNSLKCVTESGANRNYYTLTLPETFTDEGGKIVEPKYVRIGAADVRGYCRAFAIPTITWEASKGAGAFSVQNNTMVYPTADDLKLDFNGADISELTKENLTVTDASGMPAEIAEISVNGSTVAVTFAEALKPYTDYTVTVSEDATELVAYTQKFKTTPAFEKKSFKDTTMADKSWFTSSSNVTPKPDTGDKHYYKLGWYYSPRFLAEGKMKTLDGEVINGTISEVEFVLGYYARSYNISSGKVEAIDDNDTVIAELNFEDYASDGDPEIAFESGMTPKYIKIPDGVLPRETVSVRLNIGQEGQDVAISKPGITWRDFGLNAEVAKLNGKVIPLDTVKLEYKADIDASTVTTSKFALSDGVNTVNPSEVTVNGNKVVLTFTEVLEPETAYTLSCNVDCYAARPYGTVKTPEGLNTSPDVISFETDVAYEEKSFTDTKASYGWLILNNVYVTNVNDEAYGGWYGTSSTGDNSVIFAFDNSRAKMIGDTIYRPDGAIKEIKFALGHFNNTTAKSFGISISSNGVNYTRIGTVADFVKDDDAALYNDVTFAANYVQRKYVSIDSSALNPDTKYVKIDMPQNSAALCKPSVKYLVPVVDYRMMPIYTNSVGAALNALEEGDITVTCNVEGSKASEDYVLIMASYKGGVLTDAKVSYSYEPKHQATFKITDPQTEYIKAFLFNNLDVVMPLDKSISFGPVK